MVAYQQKDLKAAFPEARRPAKNWLTYHAPNPFAMGLWFLLTAGYYVMYFPVYLISRWLIRKIRPQDNSKQY
jgi:hypothetical protein